MILKVGGTKPVYANIHTYQNNVRTFFLAYNSTFLVLFAYNISLHILQYNMLDNVLL